MSRALSATVIAAVALWGALGVYASAPEEPEWVRRVGGGTPHSDVVGMSVDGDEIRVASTSAGFRFGAKQIRPGIFIARLSTSGSLLDVLEVGRANTRSGNVAFTPDGGFVMLGLESTRFEPQSGTYLTKFDAEAEVVWRHLIEPLPGRDDRTIPIDLSVGPGGEVIALWGSPPLGDGATTGIQGKQSVVAVYERDGRLRWQAKRVGSLAGAATFDGSGRAFVASRFGLITAFDRGGRRLWRSRMVPTGEHELALISHLAADGGRICGTGVLTPTGDGEPAAWPDALVGCVDSAGKRLWSTRVGGADWDWGRAIAFGPGGSIFVTGTTESPFFEGVVTKGDEDIFLIEFSRQGDVRSLQMVGGGEPDLPSAIGASRLGAVYVLARAGSPRLGNRPDLGRGSTAVVRFR